jgi:hypothetical protein
MQPHSKNCSQKGKKVRSFAFWYFLPWKKVYSSDPSIDMVDFTMQVNGI